MYENVSVAFQGNKGSFSEEALIKFFSERAKPKACANFSATFSSISEGLCDYGIVPIENSIIGTITECFDKFLEHSHLSIVGEITLKIEHALIGFAGVEFSDVETVYSQLPGLEQCSNFLSQYKWNLVSFKDTAAAVEHVSRVKDIRLAAVASARAASIYNLTVLKENIENNEQNFTRFAVVKKVDEPLQVTDNIQYENVNVGFVIFSMPDRPGALLQCLQCFRNNSINLHKIESRPIFGKPWSYQFLVEFDNMSGEGDIAKGLHELSQCAPESHIIGLYSRDTTYEQDR